MSNTNKKPWYKIWWVWLIAAVIIIGGIGSLGNSDEPAASQPVEQERTPAIEKPVTVEEPAEEEPTPEPEPTKPLDETLAAQHLAYAWEDQFIYGGKVHWIMDRITTVNDDDTYTFKI